MQARGVDSGSCWSLWLLRGTMKPDKQALSSSAGQESNARVELRLESFQVTYLGSGQEVGELLRCYLTAGTPVV